MELATARALANRLADGGIVAAATLLEAGMPPDVLKRLRSEWEAPVPGHFVIDGRAIDDEVRARITRSVGGPGTIVSGWLAAKWLKLPWIPELPRVLGLIPADRRRRSRAFAVLRRVKAWPTIPTVDHNGISIADIAWAVIDTTRQISQRKDQSDTRKLRDARSVVLGAVGSGRVTAAELSEVLGLTAVAHSALARRAILDAERGAVSAPEAEMIDDLLTYQIAFVANVEVWINGVFCGIVDAWLLGTGVGLEQDSKQEHGDDERLDQTLVRSDRFRRNGALLDHVTPTRYRADPHAFLREAFEDVRARQAAGLGDPPGLELREARGPVLQGEGPVPYRLATAPELPLSA